MSKNSNTTVSFDHLQLDDRLLKAIKEEGFQEPTAIQQSAIPAILNGSDIRASAQTGTGKTAAFLLPSLHKMTQEAQKGRGPRVLVLTPTRELALQVAQEADKYSRNLSKVKTVCIYGGAPYPIQKRQLARHYEILVATPGRLIDFLEQKVIDLSRVEVLILDEADRMLDMGFIGPVEQIAELTPENRQTLLFSATLKKQVLQLSEKLMKDPIEINVIPSHEKHECIEQQLYFADNLGHKLDLLQELLTDDAIDQALVFTSTKSYAEELAEKLIEIGHAAGALHGDMNQRQRLRTLSKLREGRLKVLVATDVAARGIDISSITHVYNFDLPRCVEDYTHRIGRTGRAGAAGIAVSLVTPKERQLLREIESFTKQQITVKVIPGMEPKEKAAPARKTRTRQRDFAPKKSFAPRENFAPRNKPKKEHYKEEGFETPSEYSPKSRPFKREFTPKEDFPSKKKFAKRDFPSKEEYSSKKEGFAPRKEGFASRTRNKDGFSPKKEGFVPRTRDKEEFSSKRDGFAPRFRDKEEFPPRTRTEKSDYPAAKGSFGRKGPSTGKGFKPNGPKKETGFKFKQFFTPKKRET